MTRRNVTTALLFALALTGAIMPESWFPKFPARPLVPVPDSKYDLGSPWTTTVRFTENPVLSGARFRAESEQLYECPKHGRLNKGGMLAVIFMVDDSGCEAPPVCLYCLNEAAHTDGRFPTVEVSR